jgi:1-phosphofructokinase family hexose kinase
MAEGIELARSGYHVNLILTLTINPALDRIITADRLVFEDRGYILDRSEAAGGRGINASQVIHAFGGKTTALLTAGGAAGERLEKLLTSLRFPFDAVHVHAESRTNLTISDKFGLTVKLNERGLPLEASELQEIKKKVEARLPKTQWLMICGSIQPGVAPHYYCEIIEMAKHHGVKTLLDTDGAAMQHALEAKPTVIMQNQHEAERLLSRALITRGQCLEAVDVMQGMGPESVILSLGARGAIGSSPEGVFEALPPRIEALSPIGAGDALVAAFAWSMEKKNSFSEALRWGVATGTASAKLPGMAFPTFADSRSVYKQVELRKAR